MSLAETALIVLAGGLSSRMGRDKSDLQINGHTFLEIQIQKGKELKLPQIYVSGYRGGDCPEEIIMDRIEKRGPLGGLEACLRRAGEDGYEQCLVLGVDTPLVPVEELNNLLKYAECTGTHPATLLCHNGKEESLMAVYRSSLCDRIEEFLGSGRSSVFRFLGEVGYGCYSTEAEDILFTNINDPQIFREIENRFEHM